MCPLSPVECIGHHSLLMVAKVAVIRCGVLVRDKIERRAEYRVVAYSDEHWKLLRDLRQEAKRIMESLIAMGLAPRSSVVVAPVTVQ